MIKVYTYDLDGADIAERECETFGFPHRCTNGETMYENVHFLTPEEAWTALLKECEAHVSLDATEREHARKRFEKASAALADSAEKLVRAKRNRAAANKPPRAG